MLVVVVVTLLMASPVAPLTYSAVQEGLTIFPSDIPAATTVLDLEKNRIDNVNATQVEHLGQLVEFLFARNNLVELPEINRTSQTLTVLDLSGNSIFIITPDFFLSFQILNSLILMNNQITYLSDNAFAGLTTLRFLMLSNNPIHTIEYDAFFGAGPETLTKLKLKNILVTEFPCIGPHRLPDGRPNRIVELIVTLDDTQLSTISAQCVQGLSEVDSLILEMINTNLTSISNLKDAFLHARVALLNDNPDLIDFVALTPSEVSAALLEYLVLSNTTFPLFPMIQMRTTLESLFASHARIQCVPSTRLSDFTRLINLDLSENSIQLLPDSSCYDETLDAQTLSDSGIGSDILFTSLVRLNLTNNELRELPAVGTMPVLLVLKLAYNFLTTVSWDAMTTMPLLQWLDLSNNLLISFLPDLDPLTDLATFLGSLTHLNLSSNSLASMQANMSVLSAHVYLEVNPLVCDGRLCWMKQWTLQDTHLHLDQAPCFQPLTFSGVAWIDITDDQLCSEPGNPCRFIHLILGYLSIRL